MKNQRPVYGRGFTLIELLVSIAILAMLIGVIIPSLSGAREQARQTQCLARLKGLGGGLLLYANEYDDHLLPGRMPKGDNNTGWVVEVNGGLKYRPTFVAMMGTQIGTKPFKQPLKDNSFRDVDNQLYDRQNYASPDYVCPATPDWVDERNGSYAYNYQFLGNARLFDGSNLSSFKNWPLKLSRARNAAELVAVGDGMGTAASFPIRERGDYEDNSKDANRFGNEGFNLDPPAVDPQNGEMANFGDATPTRSAVHPRHGKSMASILWLDGHASPQTAESLGYEIEAQTGIFTFNGNNRLWRMDRQTGPWLAP